MVIGTSCKRSIQFLFGFFSQKNEFIKSGEANKTNDKIKCGAKK